MDVISQPPPASEGSGADLDRVEEINLDCKIPEASQTRTRWNAVAALKMEGTSAGMDQ